MEKKFLEQLVEGKLSSTDTLFYVGIANANGGLIRLAAAVEREKILENQQSSANKKEKERE